MQTLYFTRRFTKGALKGLTHQDKITFPTVEGCTEWLAAVAKNASKLGYVIVDRSFQSYAR